MTENLDLLSSFRAVIADETSKHRGPDAGMVTSFVGEVRNHQQRYLAKIANLRARKSGTQLDEVENQITRMSDEAIAAAMTAGRVDFAA